MSETPESNNNPAPMQNPFQGLDADKLKAAGLPTKLMLGGSVGFFVFAFFDWWSVDSGPFSASANAFDSFRGTLAFLLMIGVGVLALLMLLNGPNQNFVYGALGGSGLALLCTLWYWAAIPSSNIASIDYGPAFGLYLSLIAAIVSVAGAVMTFQAFKQNN